MRQPLSLITLGVRNKQRSVKFYEALGWTGTDAIGDSLSLEDGHDHRARYLRGSRDGHRLRGQWCVVPLAPRC
jgi:catechol 2,3-dioxygenase-like lactoylglutathione lyase family enzyme